MTSKKRATVDLDRVIGQRIRTARLEAKYSQSELGTALNVSFQQVQKYEKGVNRVSTASLHEIARVLQKPITFFVSEQKYAPNELGEQIAEFMATRPGVTLVTQAMLLDEALLYNLIDITKKLVAATVKIQRPPRKRRVMRNGKEVSQHA